jgi:hypothetical protein
MAQRLYIVKQYFGLYCKGKVFPLHPMDGAWGEKRYSSCCFLTSALEGGEWSASRPGRALPPGKQPPVPILQEAGWASKPVWTQRLEETPSASVGDRLNCVSFHLFLCLLLGCNWPSVAFVKLMDE